MFLFCACWKRESSVLQRARVFLLRTEFQTFRHFALHLCRQHTVHKWNDNEVELRCVSVLNVTEPSLSCCLHVSRSKKISVESARWCGGNQNSPRTSALSQPWSCTGEPRKCWQRTTATKRPHQIHRKPAAAAASTTEEPQAHRGQHNNRTLVSQSSPAQHRAEQPQLHLTRKMSKAAHLSLVRLSGTSGALSLLTRPPPCSLIHLVVVQQRHLWCWMVLHDHHMHRALNFTQDTVVSLSPFPPLFFLFSCPPNLLFRGAVLPPSGRFSQVFCSVCVWAVFSSCLFFIDVRCLYK